MARLPRYVIPGQPQHIIQRGNNRQLIFAAEADYQFFRDAPKNKWGQTRYLSYAGIIPFPVSIDGATSSLRDSRPAAE